MLVFVIPTSYPNPENPVANSFVMEQVKALSMHSDCKIVVLNVQKKGTKKIFRSIDKNIHFVKNEEADIIRTKSKTFFEKKLMILNLLAFNISMKRLYEKAVERYGKPDIIYAHFYAAAYSAIRIASKSNVPVVVMEHSGELMKSHLHFRETVLLKYVINHSCKYIATTSNLKTMVKKHTRTKKAIEVISNIVDDSFSFYPLQNSNTFTYVAVSRLEYDKRIDMLINAFCEAFNKNENVCLRIGGMGSEYAHLQHLIESAGRNNQIKLLGVLKRNDVVTEIRNSSCFVLPSRHETFGLVWREALCVGRPVITTDHGGFSSYDWNDEFGIMIPVDDKPALVEALRNIKTNYDKYNLEHISTQNRKMYSSKVVGDAIYSLLMDEIKEK